MSSCDIHIPRGKTWNNDCQEMGRTVRRGWRISIECCKVSVGEADADCISPFDTEFNKINLNFSDMPKRLITIIFLLLIYNNKTSNCMSAGFVSALIICFLKILMLGGASNKQGK